MIIQRMKIWTIVFIVVLSLVAACGKSSSDTASVYKVEYIPGTGMNAPVQGKTTFQLRITKRSDDSPATGLTPSLTMTMHMSDGDSHATPVDSITQSATAGLYDCTVYYLMASGPGMGTWEMNVTVDGETTTFNPDVAMAMGGDTVHAKLYGADDIVTGMSGTSYNKYYIFRDGMISASMPTLKLYISHGENMMMDFKAVSVGSILSSPTGTVTDVTVTASTNPDFATSVTGTNNTNGHFSLADLDGLVSGATNTIYIKLNVNGQDKTTDGAVASGENGYATFVVTPE